MDHLQWFNDKAATWDTIATGQTRRLLYNIVQNLNITPGSSVLDVATGTGILVPWLLEAVGTGGRLAAFDFAPEMIARAKEKFKSGVEFLVADVHSLPLKDEVFDEVICNSAFPHFARKPRAMAEMSRVLKNKGRLTICHPAPREQLNEFHKNVIGGVVGGDMLPPADEMVKMAREAGLIDISIVDGPDTYVLTARKEGSE